ncbi:hypothetical protein BDW22DRAFT_1379280 [Trametopsis cervina]|nr:hypothetical protein BDW22DRAFT_1379280 [Trametopsis cervina]
MAPRASRSSGKIVIKPRTPARTTRAAAGPSHSPAPRNTIRIPRTATASKKEETPDDDVLDPEDEDGDVEMDVAEEEEGDGDVDGEVEGESALTSRAQTVEEAEEDVQVQEGDVEPDVEAAEDEGEVEGEGDAEVEGEDVGTPRDADEDEDDTTTKTPRGRGRGRPRGRPRGGGVPRARGRGRGRARGKGRLTTRSRRDRDEEPEIEYEDDGRVFRRIGGNVVYIDGDEYVTEDNPKGDEKIDKDGNLLGGRQFKANTFVLPNRDPQRRYMLAIDAARSSGFRDSLYYFRRNSLALKLIATQAEKDFLIDAGKLGSHLRTRSVTLITARSAYKLHGAKMILDGRWVVDDYNEEKVLEDITARGLKPGDPVGELQDTSTIAAEAAALAGLSSRDGGKQERGGASAGIYRPGGPTTIFGGSGWGPYSEGPLNAVKKSMLNRDGVSEENWMAVAAQRTLDIGEEWKVLRKKALRASSGLTEAEAAKRQARADDMDVDVPGGNVKRQKTMDSEPKGVYDPQTGLVFHRSDTQPTRARWEYVDGARPVLGNTKVGSGAWGVAWVDTAMELPPAGEEERYRLEALRIIMEES